METFFLLQQYLISQNLEKKDVCLTDYSIDGSIITLVYSYDYGHSWGREGEISYGNKETVSILDYLTWISNNIIELIKK